MKNMVWFAALVLSLISLSSARAAEVCAIDSRCNNSDYPFRIFYAANGVNVTGECERTFEAALKVYRKLASVGQCKAGTAPRECGMGSCNYQDYPFAIVYQDGGEKVTGRCYANIELAQSEYLGLKSTGQCKRASQTRKCIVDRGCHLSGYPFRVVYQDDKKSVTNTCHISLDTAISHMKSLQLIGQCAY